MNKIKCFYNKYGRYIFVFTLVFLIYEFFGWGITYGDPVANYGFSYAISKGQIPYRDFNIITTPLYAFTMSIGLLFFNNYLMFILEQSLLVTIVFYFLYKLYEKKSYWILFVFILFGFFGLLPTYNFFCYGLMVILLYLEKYHNDKDYLIGGMIGLTILAKHTVGAFFVLPTLILYFKDYKKILRRVAGALIPGIIFISYLILSNSFFDFFNLCFGGLLDFSSNNGNPTTRWFYISVVMFIISLIIVFKDRKNIINWYLIFSFMFVVPLFDICHFALYAGCFLMMILPYIKKSKFDNYFDKLSIMLIITVCLINVRMGNLYKPVFMKKINHFQYTLNSKYSYDMNLKFEKFISKYEDPLLISYHKMFYDITNNKRLDYYDVIMYGNFGYDGVNKMIKDIKNMHNRYIIVDMNSYLKKGKDEQFVKEIAEYVMGSCKKIDSKYGFDVYYKE